MNEMKKKKKVKGSVNKYEKIKKVTFKKIVYIEDRKMIQFSKNWKILFCKVIHSIIEFIFKE